MNQTAITSATIKQWAQELGFTLAGVTSAAPVDSGIRARLLDYLHQGYHGEMHYLARNLDKRTHAGLLLKNSRSIICTATNYYFPDQTGPSGPSTVSQQKIIARFARGQDYHTIIRSRLHSLAECIKQVTAQAAITMTYRCFVDTAPLLEKYYAWQAGLGWPGKNSLLIHPHYGSWLLLGEIITNLELQPDTPMPDQCGSCQQCLSACPTGALVKPRILDARRCLSYYTVEKKGPLPPEWANLIQRRHYGCDLCQEACPFNAHPIICDDEPFCPQENKPL